MTTSKIANGRYHSDVQKPTDETVLLNWSTEETSRSHTRGDIPLHNDRRRMLRKRKTNNGFITSLGSTLIQRIAAWLNSLLIRFNLLDRAAKDKENPMQRSLWSKDCMFDMSERFKIWSYFFSFVNSPRYRHTCDRATLLRCNLIIKAKWDDA